MDRELEVKLGELDLSRTSPPGVSVGLLLSLVGLLLSIFDLGGSSLRFKLSQSPYLIYKLDS